MHIILLVIYSSSALSHYFFILKSVLRVPAGFFQSIQILKLKSKETKVEVCIVHLPNGASS